MISPWILSTVTCIPETRPTARVHAHRFWQEHQHSKKKTCVILDDPSDSKSSSISEGNNSLDEGEKNYIAYNSKLSKSDEGNNSATDTKEETWNNGYRDGFIIDKLNNSKFKIK